MNLIEALTELSNKTDSVRHFQGEVWDIGNLLMEIDEDALEESGEAGEWTVDSAGIEHLDENGYRDGQRYDIAA